jgi:glycosyltransferase involved in cell wall biosynthesis
MASCSNFRKTDRSGLWLVLSFRIYFSVREYTMRILHVTNAYPPHFGGTENYVFNLADKQRFLGNVVCIITSRLPSNCSSDENVTRLPVLYDFKGAWGELPICPTVFRALKQADFEITHGHAPSRLFLESALFMKCLAKKKKPFIVTYHLHNEGLTNSERIAWNIHNQLVMSRILSNADKIIVLTEKYKTLVKDVFHVNQQKIEVVPPGVDDETFDPKKYKTEEIRKRFEIREENIIVFIGRLTIMKGISYLIQALPTVLSAVPDTSLVIIGDGVLANELRALSRRLGIDSHIRFMGSVPDKDLPQILSLASVVVLPSITEGFGLVLLEAMSMEKAVVATRVGGIQDVVIDGKTGFLVEKRNVDELAEAILGVLSDQELAKSMGDFGRKLVREKYNWTIIAKKILEIYEDTLSFRGN